MLKHYYHLNDAEARRQMNSVILRIAQRVAQHLMQKMVRQPGAY